MEPAAGPRAPRLGKVAVLAMAIGGKPDLLFREMDMDNCTLDYEFRCHHCVQVIAKDKPVYMRRDHSYCSSQCRRRGRSAIFLNMRLAHRSASRSTFSESIFSPTLLSSALSASSLASSLGQKGELAEHKPRGPISWIVSGIFSVLAARVPGAQELVQSASELLMRSKIPEDASVKGLAGYPPGETPSEDGSVTPSCSGSSETLLGPFGLYSALR